jgi:hypothetical protein
MSKYNSPFIQGSADSQYDGKVDEHFSGAKGRTMPGVATGEYTRKWGSKDVMTEFLNSETGVNHKHNGAKGNNPKG